VRLSLTTCDTKQVDKLAALSGKVNSVKLVMQSNVDAALQNCVKLESIEAQAGMLFVSIFSLILKYMCLILTYEIHNAYKFQHRAYILHRIAYSMTSH